MININMYISWSVGMFTHKEMHLFGRVVTKLFFLAGPHSPFIFSLSLRPVSLNKIFARV